MLLAGKVVRFQHGVWALLERSVELGMRQAGPQEEQTAPGPNSKPRLRVKLWLRIQPLFTYSPVPPRPGKLRGQPT